MPGPRREVRRSARFLAKAQALYPPGGSPDGGASFELFEQRVLRAAELQFARDFENLPVALADVPAIRHVMTHAVPLFAALVIYGISLSDGTIELMDLDVDEEYWGLVADDPDD